MAIIKYKIKGFSFEYDDDASWKKWKKIASDEISEFEKIHWIVENVLIFPENSPYTDVMRAADYVSKQFKIRRKPMKKYLKVIGKMFRGISIPHLHHKAIEYEVLREMKGAITISDLEEMDFLDVIFYRRMLNLEHQRNEDIYKKQEAEMKARARKGRR